MRRNAFGMIIWNGQPAIWLTINVNDLGNPLCCKVAGIQIPLSIPPALRKKLRKVAATNDPVSSARFFKIIIDAFINHMIISGEEGGIFGPCDSYFATTEASGRGALHFHCLVWITGNVGIHNLRSRIVSDLQFAALVIEYMEDMIQQSLNIIDGEEEESEPLLERIVRP